MSAEALQTSPQYLGYATRERRWRRACELTDARGVDALLVFGKKGQGQSAPIVASNDFRLILPA